VGIRHGSSFRRDESRTGENYLVQMNNRKMTGTMRESRALVRSVNACQRAEAALLLVEVATSALDEIAEGDVPQGNGAGNEMELLLEIQERDRKMLDMNGAARKQSR